MPDRFTVERREIGMPRIAMRPSGFGGKATFGPRRLACLTMALRNNPPSDHDWEYKKERPLVRTTDRSYFHQRLAEIYSAKTNNHQPADHQPAHGMTRHVAPEDLLKPNFALHRTSLPGPTYFDNAAKPLLPQLAGERGKLVESGRWREWQRSVAINRSQKTDCVASKARANNIIS